VITCASCGKELPGEFPFCPFCGAELGAVPAAPVHEERKVVSVLFCDLVGFTSRAEQLDPEDVRALLGPYYGRLRTELERFGGTVEKFIGDAVMALFGAPVATRTIRSAQSGRRSRSVTGSPSRTRRCRCGSRSPPARRSWRSAPGFRRARGWRRATW